MLLTFNFFHRDEKNEVLANEKLTKQWIWIERDLNCVGVMMALAHKQLENWFVHVLFWLAVWVALLVLHIYIFIKINGERERQKLHLYNNASLATDRVNVFTVDTTVELIYQLLM